jgi:hypothetical protein
MANYRLKANGNTNTLATWQDDSTGSFVDSTVLPSAADNIYANNFVGQINADLTVNLISNRAATGITAGGRFEIPNAVTFIAITQDVATFNGTNVGILQVTANSVTVNIAIASSTNSAGNNTVSVSVTGTGNIINCTGNFTGGVGIGSNAIRLAGGNTFNHTGNITAGSASSTFGIITLAACTLVLNGNYTATSSVPCISNVGISTITINGVMTGSAAFPVITMTQGTLTLSGQVISVGDKNAIDCRGTTRLHPTLPTSFTYQTSGADRTCYAIPDSDVRSGVLAGTLAVPNPSNVVAGVPTDNTVGTYSTTPSAIVSELFSQIAAGVDPIAERLKNVATVDTTGDQIATI